MCSSKRWPWEISLKWTSLFYLVQFWEADQMRGACWNHSSLASPPKPIRSLSGQAATKLAWVGEKEHLSLPGVKQWGTGEAGFFWRNGDMSMGGPPKVNLYLLELGVKTNIGQWPMGHTHKHPGSKTLQSFSNTCPSLEFGEFHRVKSSQGKAWQQN